MKTTAFKVMRLAHSCTGHHVWQSQAAYTKDQWHDDLPPDTQTSLTNNSAFADSAGPKTRKHAIGSDRHCVHDCIPEAVAARGRYG